MATLTFHRLTHPRVLSKRDRKALTHIESMYDTSGPATHIAFPSNPDETVFAFPIKMIKQTKKSKKATVPTRFIIVWNHFHETGDEYGASVSDEELEAGINTHQSFY